MICTNDLGRPRDQRVSDFIEGSSSLNVTTLPDLVALKIMVVKKMNLIYDMTSRDHVFKEFYNFVGDSFS